MMDQANETMRSYGNKENPFSTPIIGIFNEIRGIPWGILHFIPQIIQFLVLSIVLIVLCVLYCTIGIVFNCYSIFRSLLLETCNEFKDSDLIGKSAYAVMAGIYLLFYVPCVVILLPFFILGWFWGRMQWLGLALFAVLVASLVVAIIKYNDIAEQWSEWAGSAMQMILTSHISQKEAQ